MSETENLRELRRAKQALKEKLGGRAGIGGIGIARGPVGYRLRLTVDPEAGIAEQDLPKTFRGFEVEVVRLGRYRAREVSPGTPEGEQ